MISWNRSKNQVPLRSNEDAFWVDTGVLRQDTEQGLCLTLPYKLPWPNKKMEPDGSSRRLTEPRSLLLSLKLDQS